MEGYHPHMASILCSAKLTPLRKGGQVDEEVDPYGHSVDKGSPVDQGVRPIVSSETLQRLSGKLLMRQPSVKTTVNKPQPDQLGVVVPLACQMIATAARQVVKTLWKEEMGGGAFCR